jgi:hypothetical protein
MIKRHKYLIIALVTIIIVLLSILLVKCSQSPTNLPAQPSQTPAPTSTSVQIPTPPKPPINLTIKAESSNTVIFQWTDNSINEDGYIIYRDNTLIAKIGANSSTYQDINLKPSTTYQYAVKAYNQAGESEASTYTIKTLNPPVTIRLDRIGVYDNREDIIRGEDGEVYLYIVISDGKNTTQKLRFPQVEGQHYKLAKNESTDVNSVVFSTDEVGNRLSLFIVGFEDDGGSFEPYVYKAIGAVVETQLAGSTGVLLDVFDINLSGLIGQFLGEEDDFLGAFERVWDDNNNWGTGIYTDVLCKDERGVDCLRLWFSITSE